MTLTVGSGPLAGSADKRTNFTVDGPKHRLILEDYPLRLRAVVGGRVVLDSTRARILHETGHQIVPYVPLEDFDAELLERSGTRTYCPFKGEASYWSVRIDGGGRPDAVWAYEEPLGSAVWLKGLASLAWDAADAWYVEEDRAFGPHLRDPYHRVDVWESARPVTVRARGRVIARSDRPKLLTETSRPLRVYLPRADVETGVLVPSDTRTQCPYKGEAAYWSVEVDGERLEDAAWVYETPLPEVAHIAGHLCFLADGIDVELQRPPATLQAGPRGV